MSKDSDSKQTKSTTFSMDVVLFGQQQILLDEVISRRDDVKRIGESDPVAYWKNSLVCIVISITFMETLLKGFFEAKSDQLKKLNPKKYEKLEDNQLGFRECLDLIMDDFKIKIDETLLNDITQIYDIRNDITHFNRHVNNDLNIQNSQKAANSCLKLFDIIRNNLKK